MAAEEKLLVVVGVHEGRGFPSKPRHDLVIEIQFAGETLQSDPVDHSIGGHIIINNELAWEMTRKALQEHKLQRTPIKLLCYCVNRITQKRVECGTVMLDLRSVQQAGLSNSLSSHWYSLLRCQYTGKRPELKLSLTSETESTTQLPPSQEEGLLKSLSLTPPSSLPPLVLDEGNGWYLLGTPSSHQILYTVSLTLSQPHNLSNVSHHSRGNYTFKYSLLGNEIITEEFTSLDEPCDFQAERASVRVKATPTLIKELLLRQPDIQIDLVSGGVVLASGTVPIKPLANSQHFSVSCSLGNKGIMGGVTTPTINVTLAIQNEKSNDPPLSSSSSSPSLSIDNKAKRNLAQSFEEVSNSSNISVSVAPPTVSAPKVPHPSSTSPHPSSPYVTTPIVPSPPRITFTSPKTSPLVLSQSMSPRHSPLPPPPLSTSPPPPPSPSSYIPTTVITTTTSISSPYREERGKGSVVFSKPGSIRPHPTLTTHSPSSPVRSYATSMGGATTIQTQLEYKSAMELEIWKMNQEELFKKELKEREEAHMKLLTEEFQKRDKHRENIMKQKLEHYQSLEAQLSKTLKELDTQRQKLKTREYEMSSTQRRLEDERKAIQFDVEREKSLLQTGMEGSLQIEKLKSKELSLQLDRARRQVTELETRLAQKEVEFETYKGRSDTHMESQLQAELGLLKLEKTELEHKLETANKSKFHYKEQWSKALKEIASLKHREQTVLRDQLKKQQLELENMREKYLAAEEHQSLQKQLQHLKDETHRLRAHTLASPAPPPPTVTHRIPTPSPPRLQNVDSNIARWIEERNILLQTGVYTHADSTIQKLDRKIQEALLDKKSQHDFSS